MRDTPSHLQALEEIERDGISGLAEVLHEEGIDGIRYVFGMQPAGIETSLPLLGETGLLPSRSR